MNDPTNVPFLGIGIALLATYGWTSPRPALSTVCLLCPVSSHPTQRAWLHTAWHTMLIDSCSPGKCIWLLADNVAFDTLATACCVLSSASCIFARATSKQAYEAHASGGWRTRANLRAVAHRLLLQPGRHCRQCLPISRPCWCCVMSKEACHAVGSQMWAEG